MHTYKHFYSLQFPKAIKAGKCDGWVKQYCQHPSQTLVKSVPNTIQNNCNPRVPYCSTKNERQTSQNVQKIKGLTVFKILLCTVWKLDQGKYSIPSDTQSNSALVKKCSSEINITSIAQKCYPLGTHTTPSLLFKIIPFLLYAWWKSYDLNNYTFHYPKVESQSFNILASSVDFVLNTNIKIINSLQVSKLRSSVWDSVI